MQKQQRINNEQGITLIELLLAITIGTIIIGLAFSVLLNSINAYKKTERQQLLQQEANLLLTQLRTIHRGQATYTIAFDSAQNIYTINLADGTTQLLSNSNYNTQIKIDGLLITSTSPATISSTTKNYNIAIKMATKDAKNECSIKTGLTRL